MSASSERFKRYGSDATLDRLIKDCRDLQEQVDRLQKQVEDLIKEK